MNNTYLLVAEDEPAHVEAIRSSLEKVTVELNAVGSLREYKASVAERMPDIALVDLNLPDGRALDILTPPPETAPFPVIVMTAYGNEMIVAEVLRAGALNYLVKSPDVFATLPSTLELALREWRLLQTHRRSEAALRVTLQELKTVKAAVDEHAIVAITDTQGLITYANDKFCAISKYSREELLGQDHRILNSGFHPKAFFRDLWETVSHGRVWKGNVKNKAKDGTFYWVDTTVVPFLDAAGEPYQYVAIRTDITKSKQSERVLKEAKEAAEAANRAKDQFIAVLSHELRTPLTPVLLTVSALETDTTLTSNLHEELSMIRRNVELEASLIDDLLDLNRLAYGKILLRLQLADLHSILGNMQGICREDIQAKHLKLRMELNASRHYVNADEGRLQQVFSNLLRNAIKFTPANGIITIRTSNSSAGMVQTEVADSGRGIAHEVISTLFVAFEQGKGKNTLHSGGLGLGLAICKSLVELHGGKIWAESKGEQQGSTFYVELPTTIGSEPTGTSAAPARSDAEWNPKVGDRNVRILLVEDHADTARILRRLLERGECKVTTAQSVGSALAAASETRERNEKFDLLISDLGLPDGDGRQIMQELHDRDGLTGIAISGFGMEEDVKKSRAAGFAEHLTKPIQFGKLQRAITVITNRTE